MCRTGGALGAVAARPESRAVQPAALADHRPGGQPLLLRRGRRRRSLHLLRRRRLGRHLEDHRRRHQLDADLRRPAGAVDRVARRRPLRSEHRLGRDRRGQDPQSHLAGPGHLQVHGRRQDLGADGPGADRADSAPGDPPQGSGHRPGVCARPRLRAAAGAGRIPDHRRRADVDQDALHRRERRLLGHRHGSEEPARAVRRDVDARNPYLGTRQRRPWQRPVHLARRRRDLDPAAGPRTADQAGRQGGRRHLGVEPAAGLRADRNRRRRAMEGPGDRTRPAVADRQRRRHLAGRQLRPQRDGPRPLLLADGGGARRSRRGLLPDRVVLEVDRRRAHHHAATGPSGPRPGHAAGRRPPRHLDRSDQPGSPDRRPRPGALDHHQPRQDLVPPALEERADLPRHRRQRDSLQRARQQAGRADLPRPEQQPHSSRLRRRCRHPAGDVERGRRRREWLGHARSRRIRTSSGRRPRGRGWSAASSCASSRTAASSATSRSGPISRTARPTASATASSGTRRCRSRRTTATPSTSAASTSTARSTAARAGR